MYAPSSVFRPPEDPNIRVWHYMDLFKFLWMLDSSALYFARLDTLDDPFEGEYTARDYREHSGLPSPEEIRSAQKRIHVHCWHMNEHESAAMWKMYSHAGHGIALQSTFGRLRDAFVGNEHPVHIGMVDYRDYANDRTPESDIGVSALSKRKSFAYEHELRAAVLLPPGGGEDMPDGVSVPVDLDKLIEHIYLSPALHAWQERTLHSTLRRFGIEKLLKRSELALRPEHTRH